MNNHVKTTGLQALSPPNLGYGYHSPTVTGQEQDACSTRTFHCLVSTLNASFRPDYDFRFVQFCIKLFFSDTPWVTSLLIYRSWLKKSSTNILFSLDFATIFFVGTYCVASPALIVNWSVNSNICLNFSNAKSEEFCRIPNLNTVTEDIHNIFYTSLG